MQFKILLDHREGTVLAGEILRKFGDLLYTNLFLPIALNIQRLTKVYFIKHNII